MTGRHNSDITMHREGSPSTAERAILNPLNTDRRPSFLRGRRTSSIPSNRRKSSERRRSITRAPEGKKWWKFTLRPWDDDQETDWWFASTAIPLIAAAIAPLANVLSIAALVTYWRMCLIDGVDPETCSGDTTSLLADLNGHTYADPGWCYDLNIVSLILGFVGNLFLLFNFTNRVRYIIALPVTILLWYAATGILIGITISMNKYVPPVGPQQIYTQGFWYAVIAAVLYLICSMLLMVNMLGYFLGHYPQTFDLTESQRNLILQSMLFFIWLAGGAGIFSKVESTYGEGLFNWSYVNSLYYCDVTILTVGFGDLYPSSNVGRGLVFPYSVGGIIMLGLVISSITKFATELGNNKVLQKHVERIRTRTIERSVTSSMEFENRRELELGMRPPISAPFDPVDRNISLRIVDNKEDAKQRAKDTSTGPMNAIRRTTTLRPQRKPRLVLLREERDRFNAMRSIERKTQTWKRWSRLCISVFVFGILWCIGALLFYIAERHTQGITYFQSLYLCYVSLLTIGYGDLAPKSNAGRPFFVVWSLVAVPTMTILIADMGDTIISNFKRGAFRLADFTILPKAGIWHAVVVRTPLGSYLQHRKDIKAMRQRLARGFETGDADEDAHPTIEKLVTEEKDSDAVLARRLARAIRRTADDLNADPPRRYTYEEWVQFTKLIRFTSGKEGEDKSEGLVEWDWIGEDSPLVARETEAEFVLDRLCESLGRYLGRVASRDEGLEVERKVDDDVDVGEGEGDRDRESGDTITEA